MKLAGIGMVIAGVVSTAHTNVDWDRELVLRPTEGLELKKSFSLERSDSFSTVEVTIDGTPISAAEIPAFSVETSESKQVVVFDTYTEVDANRARRITRKIDTIEHNIEASVVMDPVLNIEDDNEGTFDLNGAEVTFAWDPDEEVYAAGSEDDLIESRLLEGLVQDMDFAEFLPWNAVSVGETWDIEPRLLRAILEPGGDMAGDYPNEEIWTLALPFELGGQLDCTLERIFEENDTPRLELLVEGELSLSFSTETNFDYIPQVDGDGTQSTIRRMQVTMQLIWDPTRGHAQSMALTAPYETTITLERDPELPGQSFQAVLTLEGELNAEATIEEQ